MGSSKKSKGGVKVEWCKHFRPWLRRIHWGRVRSKTKNDIKKQLDECD